MDHYEAALAQEASTSTASSPIVSETCIGSPSRASFLPSATRSYNSGSLGNVQSWLQRMAAMKTETFTSRVSETSLSNLCQSTASRQSVITSTKPSQLRTTPTTLDHQQYAGILGPRINGSSSQSLRSPMKYSDLPYMGEITLENSKPRRGRKPKKADICHLIYKNYGTIVSGSPTYNQDSADESKFNRESSSLKFRTTSNSQRSDIQNRISSLLEKRLTQEQRQAVNKQLQIEPLNLCIKDLNLLRLQLVGQSEASSEAEDESNSSSADQRTPTSVNGQNCNNCESSNSSDEPVVPRSQMNWSQSGLFAHPAALQSQFLYYQQQKKQIESKIGGTSTQETPVTSDQLLRIKRNSASIQAQPMKRKRSAIFIPPMPAENNNNPANEVSICKFKFTGGAKPSLQEKKSLSVDSGGNFRYYSGTGDKSMRGYEFFPREALRQQSNNTLSESADRMKNVLPVQNQNLSVNCQLEEARRKRKSRKSVQREKLEQTFKEKGFLIQTQQLESAEGATYCKFRQLRKFTRYLFRSWKDYLPGNVRELSAEEAAATNTAEFVDETLAMKEIARDDNEPIIISTLSPDPSLEGSSRSIVLN